MGRGHAVQRGQGGRGQPQGQRQALGRPGEDVCDHEARGPQGPGLAGHGVKLRGGEGGGVTHGRRGGGGGAGGLH